MSAENSNGVKYTLSFVNNSSNAGSMMVFQEDTDIGVDGVFSLAWFTKFVNQKTKGHFQWTIDYNFVWSETGELEPGVSFLATQDPAADLSTTNGITLTYNRAYDFIDQRSRSPQGSLYIVQDSTIPLKQASVGIGMSGAGTFVVQAQPNFNLTFTPKPKYYIAFGNYSQGDVLNIQEVNNPALIDFQAYNTQSMTAVLGPDNGWTVSPTSDVNANFLAAKKRNKKAVWGS